VRKVLKFPDQPPVGWRKLLPIFRKTLFSTLAAVVMSPFMLVFAILLLTTCFFLSLLLIVNIPYLIRTMKSWGESDWGDDDDDDDGEPIPVPEERQRLAA